MTRLPKFLIKRIPVDWIDRLFPEGWAADEKLSGGRGRGATEKISQKNLSPHLNFSHFEIMLKHFLRLLGFTGIVKFNNKIYFFRRNSIWSWQL